jgi:hypothetical protein
MIGQKLSKSLEEIEATLWEFEAHYQGKPNYTIKGFRGALKIAMSAIMDKMWELQEKEEMSLEDRGNMATACGERFMALVKEFTDIDTHTLYE